MLRTISPRYMPEIIFSKACLRLERINPHRRDSSGTDIRIDRFAIEFCVELRQRENFSLWVDQDGKEDCPLGTHGVVERAPFCVDNHLPAVAGYCRISGELLQCPLVFDIGTVRSRSEDATEQAVARGVRSCKQGTNSLMGAQKSISIRSKGWARTSLTRATHFTRTPFRLKAS